MFDDQKKRMRKQASAWETMTQVLPLVIGQSLAVFAIASMLLWIISEFKDD